MPHEHMSLTIHVWSLPYVWWALMEGANPSPAPASPQGATNTATGAPATPQAADDPEIDFGNGLKFKRSQARDQLARVKELERGSHERFQQAAQHRKQAEALVAGFKQDPERYFEQLTGQPFDQFAAKRLLDKMKMQEMAPEVREAYEAKNQLEIERREKQALLDEKKQQAEAQESHRWMQHWDNQIAQVLKSSDLPHSPKTVLRVVEKMIALGEQGVPVERIPLSTIVSEIRQDVQGELVSLLSSIEDAGKLTEFFGPDLAKKVRKALMSEVTKSKPSSRPTEQRPSTKKEDPRMGLAAWRQHIRSL